MFTAKIFDVCFNHHFVKIKRGTFFHHYAFAYEQKLCLFKHFLSNFLYLDI